MCSNKKLLCVGFFLFTRLHSNIGTCTISLTRRVYQRCMSPQVKYIAFKCYKPFLLKLFSVLKQVCIFILLSKHYNILIYIDILNTNKLFAER